jgi:serine/threonine protein kinase/thioredoxin-like negative regulator of GroEL
MDDEAPGSSGDLDDADLDPIEEAVARYIDDLTAGKPIDRMQVLIENPGIGDAVIERLEEFISLWDDDQVRRPLGTLGDFTLRRQIGRGGMGVVYEAWEDSMERRVALKVLPAGVAADEHAFQRFLREARTAGKLSHPSIVPIFATGIKDQTPYYAMEYVEGETLAQILRRLKDGAPEAERPFGKKDDIRSYAVMAEAFAAVADGLQHAHSKGVIHRDIKPSNLILDRENRLRILDFGLAHLEGQESITASGDLLGTPLYMSPEQARRKRIPVDRRTDIYSLGATLYEMLAGSPPFRGKDHRDTLNQIIERDPAEPRSLNPRVPRDLETIVLKCLRKDPAERYGTAEALGQDLRRFVRGDPVEARRESRWERLSRRLRRNRAGLLAAACLSVLLGTLGWSVWQEGYARREAAHLRHDATVRDAAIDLFGGQLTLLGQDMDELSAVHFMFRAGKFRKGTVEVEDILGKLEKAAEAAPGRPDAPYYLAILYRLAGDEESADREAARALERDPRFVPAEVMAREIDLDRGALEEPEIESILERFERKPGWQEPWVLAYRHMRSRAWPQAIEAYDRLLESREPEPYVGFAVEALMGRGMALLRAKDFHGAISDFAAARGIWPRLPEAAFALGMAWHRAGQPGDAERIFVQLYIETPEEARSEIAAWILGVHAEAGDDAKVGEWYARIDGWARNAIDCLKLFWEGRHEECIEEAQKALGARPDGFAVLTMLAWAKMFNQWGRWGPRWDEERREVLELALKAVEIYPNDRHARCLLAEALQVNGRPEEALRTIDEAIRLRLRTGEECYYDLAIQGVILGLQGDIEGAERVLNDGLERYPRNRALTFELARTYELQGRYEEAEREFRALIERGDGMANRFGHLAGVLNRVGRFQEAAEAAEEGLRRLPKNTSAREHLAFALWKLGRSEEALACADAGILELPGRERLHLVKGMVLEDLGRLEEAAKAYSLELDLRLDDAEAHAALGGLLKRRPDLAAVQEVEAVAEAIERRMLSETCGPILLETFSLIREPGKAGGGAPATAGE